MLRQVTGKTIKDVTRPELHSLLQNFAHVVIDLGTGDGKFAYHYAKSNPQVFVIGIDAAVDGMQELSHKASRKPAKGGLANLMFVWAAAEQLPAELDGVAHEVYINFPWGSLLGGVVKVESAVVDGILRICADSAQVHVFLSYDTKYEPETMSQLQLPELSLEYIDTELKQKYAAQGLILLESKVLNDEEKSLLTSSWPKKILSQRQREIYYLNLGKLVVESAV